MRTIFILFLLLIFQHLLATNAQAETAHINYTDTNMYNKLKGELEDYGFTVTGTNSGTVSLSNFTGKDLHINIAGSSNCGSTCKTAYETYIGAGGTVLIAGNGDNDGNRTQTIESLVESKLSVGAITIHAYDANYTSHAQGSQYTSNGTGAWWVTRNLFTMQSGGTAIASNSSGGSTYKSWAVYDYGSNGGKLIITLDQTQFNPTNESWGLRMYAFLEETLEEEGILSAGPSTSTTTGTSSGISGGQSTQVTTDRARAATIESTSGASDNSVYIEQAGSSNTIAITQPGTAGNHIRGIGQNMADITGDSNDLEIKQGATSAGGVNLIELMIDGDTNDIELWQDRNADGSFDLDSSGDHIIKLEIDGNLNDVHIEQRSNSGSDGHYTDLDINGNSNIIDVMQASSFEKQLFTNITGNSNTLNIDQWGNGTKYMEIDLVGNGHSVTANQKDTGSHKASISLTYGSAASTVNLLQEGATDQSYSLEQTCYTVGGCSASVTQN